MSYLEKETVSLFGKVVHHGRLIEAGDHIAVGLSGGKDSVSLLWLLADRRPKIPIDYDLSAVWVDLGLPGVNRRQLEDFCRALEVKLTRVEADWDPAELGSCYECARLRRRRMFEAADLLGANVVALGHNMDDIIETFFMNLVFNGRGSTMPASQDFHRGKFRVIRPLMRIPAAKLAKFAATKGLPVQETKCALAEETSRARMRRHLQGLLKGHPKARQNIWHGISRIDPDNLPEPMGG